MPPNCRRINVCTAPSLQPRTKARNKKLEAPIKPSSTVFDIDVECPTAKGLVGLLTVQSDMTWEEFRYAVVKKMNQHMENLSIRFKLSFDDSKKGTRQLDDDDNFEGMV